MTAVRYEKQGDIAVVTVDNPPVNAAGEAVRRGLVEAAEAADADPDVRVVLLRCAGRTFIAGADIREFGKPPAEPHLPDVCNRIERARTPWVAAIHGSALGGGLEIALAAAWRIATEGARLGLPEVTLGILPGAGGTVRLPRLVGARVALEMITGGRPIGAARAREIGLVDEIVADTEDAALEFARRVAGAPRPVPTLDRQPPGADTAPDWPAEIERIRRKARGATAPVVAAEAVRDALTLSPAAALAAERERFLTLRGSDEARALRHLFFAEREAARAPTDAAPRRREAIGVVGGGTMGAGIATACLLAGKRVTLVERDATALEAGRARIENHLAGAVARGRLTPERRERLLAEALSGATGHAALADADIVIEAVFEDMDVKREVFAALDRVTRPDAILATNTSYLDVNAIARTVADPSRVLGLHFFSPAHVMKLLEIVRPDGVADDVLATGFALARDLGKQPVVAGVCDGFIGNRILARYRQEADFMLEEGALPWQIDRAMEDWGFAMGLYRVQDLAGLDIAWAMRKRRAATRDPAARYVRIADRLCEMGRFGQKTGAGWYRYDDGKAVPDPEVERIILEESARAGVTRRPFEAGEIMDRLLGVMQDEGRAILAEGIAARPSDIDVVLVNGYGFPRWRGGPMFLAGMS